MIHTGYEVVDAIINNPIQSVLIFGIVYFVIKLSRNRGYGEYEPTLHGLWRDLEHGLWQIWYKIMYRQEYSYTGVNEDIMDKLYDLVKTCGTTPNWYFYDFLQAKLKVSKLTIYQNMKALENLGRIQRRRTQTTRTYNGIEYVSDDMPYYIVGSYQ